MRHGLLVGLIFCAAIASAQAQSLVVSEHPGHVSVTIYHDGYIAAASLSQDNWDNGGLALISETRELDLPAGQTDIQFRDVASTMVPQTIDVGGLPEKVDEQNYDFSLLSPAALFAKSIDQTVHLIRTDRQTGAVTDETAIVRSGPSGYFLQIGDKFEALNCNGLPERLSFDRVPDGLFPTPTMTIHTNIPRAGHYTVTLRYLATNLNWTASYVAQVASDGRTLDLTGWLTLANFSQTSFRDAPVQVIAGHVEKTGEDEPVNDYLPPRDYACWPSKIDWASHPLRGIRGQAPVGANVISVDRSIVPRDLGDYKLYPLPEPTTVAARQTKQIEFLHRTGVPTEKEYGYVVTTLLKNLEPSASLQSLLLLQLRNTEQGKLGIPLPAGGLMSMASFGDGDAIPLNTEYWIDDTPIGLQMEITAGISSDVAVQTRLISRTTVKGENANRIRTSLEVKLTNKTQTPVTYRWYQPVQESAKLISESSPHELSSTSYFWKLTLKPGVETVFQYALDEPEY